MCAFELLYIAQDSALCIIHGLQAGPVINHCWDAISWKETALIYSKKPFILRTFSLRPLSWALAPLHVYPLPSCTGHWGQLGSATSNTRSSFGFNTLEVVDLEDLVFEVHGSEFESPYSCERPCLCLFLFPITHLFCLDAAVSASPSLLAKILRWEFVYTVTSSTAPCPSSDGRHICRWSPWKPASFVA